MIDRRMVKNSELIVLNKRHIVIILYFLNQDKHTL